jgi:hypothetical protein
MAQPMWMLFGIPSTGQPLLQPGRPTTRETIRASSSERSMRTSCTRPYVQPDAITTTRVVLAAVAELIVILYLLVALRLFGR